MGPAPWLACGFRRLRARRLGHGRPWRAWRAREGVVDLRDVRFTLHSPAQNPIQAPSGEKKGNAAPSVPGIGVAES